MASEPIGYGVFATSYEPATRPKNWRVYPVVSITAKRVYYRPHATYTSSSHCARRELVCMLPTRDEADNWLRNAWATLEQEMADHEAATKLEQETRKKLQVAASALFQAVEPTGTKRAQGLAAFSTDELTAALAARKNGND